jgi:chromosomal replication initiator protein
MGADSRDLEAGSASPPSVRPTDSPHATIWKSVLAELERDVKREQFETWFRRTALVSLDDEAATVAVPNVFFREWLGRFHGGHIVRAIERATGRTTKVRFVVDAEHLPSIVRRLPPPPDTPKLPAEPAAPAKVHRDTAPLNGAYTFEHFVVGPDNRFAHAAALGVVEKPGRAYNPLFIHGDSGLGKTHLLQAICHSVRAQRPDLELRYLTCEDFTNHFISALENGEIERFRNCYRSADILVVDDIHLLAAKERTQDEFFHTFNTLHAAQRQIVLSSDRPPKDIRQIKDRLVSRFNGGLVAPIEPPYFETRVAILHRKARDKGREIPQGVAEFIAQAIPSNIRDLEGAITKILGYSSLTHRLIDIDLSKEALRDVISPASTPVSIDRILSVVARKFNLRVSDLQSKRRLKSVVFPRQIAMFLCRHHTRYSLEEIGALFGGRDHTTVLYAIERIGTKVKEDPSLKLLVDALVKELGSVV